MRKFVTGCGLPLALVLATVLHVQAWSMSLPGEEESPECKFGLAQSMPEKLVLPPLAGTTEIEATHEALVKMIDDAKESVRIASFYMELTPQQAKYRDHPSAKPGTDVREAIRRAGTRNVNVEIVLDKSNKRFITNEADVEYLKDVAKFKYLNMKALIGEGILHSKFIIVDNSTFYVGSANFDWRSYSQVKEIGLVGRNCPVLSQDLNKIYDTYSVMSEHETMPDMKQFPQFQTNINLKNPLVVNGLRVLMAGSPPPFNGLEGETGRSDDIDALLHTIKAARHTIDISVMNYSPQREFGFPRYYWPVIDDALREAAATRNIKVRLLFSKWKKSKASELIWYRSLNQLQHKSLRNGGIHVKLYEVPAFDDFQKKLPYSRVKHDKYMVTDGGLYLGTSNWAPEYFKNTCGVGVVMDQVWGESPSPLVQTMRDLFERDFNSEYAHELSEYVDPPTVDPPKKSPPKKNPSTVNPPTVNPPTVNPATVNPPTLMPFTVNPPAVNLPTVNSPTTLPSTS